MKTAAFCLCLIAQASADETPLSRLNGLTKMLGGDQVVSGDEVERLFEQGEVVAFRDAARGATPQSINYASSCERALDAYKLKGAGPARVVTELALVLAGLGSLPAERFRAQLVAFLGVNPADARPMPELPAQLKEIAEWASRAVERLAPRLPPREALLMKLRLAVARGELKEAAALAEKHPELGARGQAWRFAALILDGEKPKTPPLEGEAALIVRGARLRRQRSQALSLVGSEADCRRRFAHPDGTGGADEAMACAILLWDEPNRSWLQSAAKLVPAGPPGAPVRAADDVRRLFDANRPDAAGRAELLARYRKELDQMGAPGDERRALWLLGNIAAAPEPMQWTPAPDEQKELLALDDTSPCDADTFALRALAVRGNPPALAQFAASVADRCVKSGVAAATDALGLLTMMAHDQSGQVRDEVLERLALALAKAHPEDPEAVGAHADSIAARALGKGVDKAPLIALQAALSLYEEALQETTWVSGGAARARLDENAGFLSLALAERLPAKKRDPFFLRAQRHLRFALALDDHPAALATRAHFDLLTGLRLGTPPSLERLPPSPARARAACFLAAQTVNMAGGGRKYLELAHEKSPLDAPELLLAPEASLNLLLDDRGLHPAARMRAPLWLAPACDPDHLPKSK